MDLAEAASHAGVAAEARDLVQPLEAVAAHSGGELLHSSLRFARAVLSEAEEIESKLEEALSADLAAWPFTRARLLLTYGAAFASPPTCGTPRHWPMSYSPTAAHSTSAATTRTRPPRAATTTSSWHSVSPCGPPNTNRSRPYRISYAQLCNARLPSIDDILAAQQHRLWNFDPNP